MRVNRSIAVALFFVASLAVFAAAGSGTAPAPRARLQVAVTSPDVEAIVKAVGGKEVATFSLFKGCILRRDLFVEDAAMGRLTRADAMVWTGFFNESAAIYASVERLPEERRRGLGRPQWIDVSRDATRVGVPTSSCEGYVELQFMAGDPFFWLNPRNGAVIARNVAEGLARLRPERRAAFEANAAAFAQELEGEIASWERALKALPPIKVFVAQCGWQNFAQLGGPSFITCHNAPGVLDPPEAIAEQLRAQAVQVVIVDPNTPPAYRETFRSRTPAKVLTVPSSIADLPGATTYSAVFDNMVRALKEAVANV